MKFTLGDEEMSLTKVLIKFRAHGRDRAYGVRVTIRDEKGEVVEDHVVSSSEMSRDGDWEWRPRISNIQVNGKHYRYDERLQLQANTPNSPSTDFNKCVIRSAVNERTCQVQKPI